MNLKEVVLNTIHQSQKTNTVWFHLQELCGAVKLTEKKGDGWQGLGGVGWVGFNGYRDSVLQE